jgi:hypothetical protein
MSQRIRRIMQRKHTKQTRNTTISFAAYKERLSDGGWHTVEQQIKGSQIREFIDGLEVVR